MIIMHLRATFLVKKNDVFGELCIRTISYAQLCNKTTDFSSLLARFPMIIMQRYLCSERQKTPDNSVLIKKKMYGRNILR